VRDWLYPGLILACVALILTHLAQVLVAQ